MRATVLRGGQLRVEELDRPQPGPGQLLVKVRSCGICGSDIHLRNHLESMLSSDGSENGSRGDTGLVMGHEFVAEVVEFGPGTRRDLAIGDRVCSVPFLRKGDELLNIGVDPLAPGAYAEYMLLTEEFVVPVPDAMHDDAAALAEPLGIGIHAVAMSKVTPQSSALVIGCGPIGLATVAALRLSAATQIIAVDMSPMRRGLALEMGATEVLDPEISSIYEHFTNTGHADTVIFECVGKRGLMAEIIAGAPKQSRIIGVGLCPGEDVFEPLTAQLKELMLQYVVYYSPEEFASALQALADGLVNWRPWITGKVGLGGIPAAFEALSNPEKHAKVLIDPRLPG